MHIIAKRTLEKLPLTYGFSLVEVMVAVFVFSIGIFGAGATLLSSVRNTNNAYLRSQASFLADAISEKIRANPIATLGGNYEGSVSIAGTALPACPCTPAQLAQYDRHILGVQLAQQLPSGSGEIHCEIEGGAASPSAVGLPPLLGQCQIRVSWREARDIDHDGASGQHFELVFQP